MLSASHSVSRSQSIHEMHMISCYWFYEANCYVSSRRAEPENLMLYYFVTYQQQCGKLFVFFLLLLLQLFLI
jgi:hypothetical protein